jgi:TrmH family RNA methyltransferase
MHETGSAKLITDVNHPLIKRFQSLQTRTGRAKSGLYLIEGIRHVARAIDAGAPIEQLFIAPSHLSAPSGQVLARRLRQAGVPCAKLASDIYCRFSLAATPQGIGAVIRQHWLRLCDVPTSRDSCWLAVEGVRSPGNLGTILRTSEATGATGVILIGGTADPHDPATLRATMGAFFSQKLVRTSVGDFAEWIRRRDLPLIGSSPSAIQDYREIAYTKPMVIMVGSERKGLSSELIQACNTVVRIPIIRSDVDSLNVAVAAGILLYEAFYQCRAQRP